MAMSSQNDVRKIRQLWYAARLYYSLLPNNISDNEMEMSVEDWGTECAQSDDFYEKPLFIFACHITACAMRPYSIDEKKKYQRYRDNQTSLRLVALNTIA